MLHERPYTDADLPRLQAALAGWVAAAGPCGYCHPGELAFRIYAGLRGRRPLGELVRVWEAGGAIVGAAVCGRFGAAFDLFVAPELRGGAAEAHMLAAAHRITAALAAAGGEAWVLSDVFGCDVARQGLLAGLGFARYRVWDDVNTRDLAAPIPPPRLPAGFDLRPAAHGDYAALAAAHGDAFGDDWTPELYRDEVMARPGYDPARELVAVAPDGQVAAFTIIWLDALNRVGQFEPVGTRRAFQRRGLARALMSYGLAELARRGMAAALVTHDATNLPARELYRGLGFVKVDETLGYRRPAGP